MLPKAITGDKMQKLALLSILIIGAILFGACAAPSAPQSEETPPASTATSKSHIYTRGIIEVGGDGEPIELINNPDATNPTYAELLAFIKKDRTDKYSYIFGPPKVAYVCSDFAEDVHNNAEAAGIRAAWVSINISGNDEGHALNAFDTTDLGLVYIDCTGKGIWSESSNCNSWDRRAYVEMGKPYKVADIDKAKTRFRFFGSTPFEYGTFGDDGTGIMKNLEEQTLRRLETLGWIREPGDRWVEYSEEEWERYGKEGWIRKCEELERRNEEWHQKYLQVSEWLRTHDIEMVGERWVRDWMQEHEAELSRCGHEFKLDKIHVGWRMDVDCLEPPWFEPEEELREVDGIPIVWKVWKANEGWPKRLGVVKDIHIHW